MKDESIKDKNAEAPEKAYELQKRRGSRESLRTSFLGWQRNGYYSQR